MKNETSEAYVAGTYNHASANLEKMGFEVIIDEMALGFSVYKKGAGGTGDHEVFRCMRVEGLYGFLKGIKYQRTLMAKKKAKKGKGR